MRSPSRRIEYETRLTMLSPSMRQERAYSSTILPSTKKRRPELPTGKNAAVAAGVPTTTRTAAVRAVRSLADCDSQNRRVSTYSMRSLGLFASVRARDQSSEGGGCRSGSELLHPKPRSATTTSWSVAGVDPAAELFSVSAVSADDAWICGSVATGGFVSRWNGKDWTRVLVPFEDAWERLWARTDDIWIGGIRTLAHWDGKTWTSRKSTTVFGIWGTADGKNVWTTGPGDDAVQHWDGVAWSTTLRPGAITEGVWGTGPADVWVVGEKGLVLHWNGAAWSSTLTVAEGLRGTWTSPGGDVWACGSNGTLVRIRR